MSLQPKRNPEFGVFSHKHEEEVLKYEASKEYREAYELYEKFLDMAKSEYSAAFSSNIFSGSAVTLSNKQKNYYKGIVEGLRIAERAFFEFKVK